MRLRFKLVLMFVIAFLATAGLLLAVFPPLADQVTRTQLFSMARTVGLYLVHNLEKLPFSGDAAAFEKGKTHPLAVRCLMGEKGQATGA